MTAALCIDLGGTNLRAALAGSRTRRAAANWATGLRPRISKVSAVASRTDRGARRIARRRRDSRPSRRLRRHLGAEPALSRRTRPSLLFPDVTVALGNDAQLALLAEAALGAAQNAANVILLAIGTGIGSAVLSDGRIVHGARGAAASFGWACADPDDPGDDVLGWLERTASGSALDAVARSVGLANGRALIAAARAGNSRALDALKKPSAALGATLAGTAALLGSRSVIVSGGVAEGMDVLAPLMLPVLAPSAAASAEHRAGARRSSARGRASSARASPRMAIRSGTEGPP